MNNSSLKQLLVEYSQKRNKELLDSKKRKESIYSQNPRLEEIDSEISSYALSTAKAILQTNNKELLKNLEIKKQSLIKEKEEIYKSLNIDSTYFNPQFECNMCKDTGYVTENSSTKMCNCLKQRIFDLEYNKTNSFDIKKSNFSDFSSSLYSPIVNEKVYNSSISPRENIELIKKICYNFIDNFDSINEKNLLFI